MFGCRAPLRIQLTFCLEAPMLSPRPDSLSVFFCRWMYRLKLVVGARVYSAKPGPEVVTNRSFIVAFFASSVPGAANALAKRGS